MVEATTPESTLQFFDAVFNAIPLPFRQVEKSEAAPKAHKQNAKTKALSLKDLHEGVHTKIKDMQRVNREKSMSKIKELTAAHQAKKDAGLLTEKQKAKVLE